ncbi:MAG TPA: hypothetical protein PLY75_09040 [Gammaproteobacteria bacterium]|nr:hypothetical protein [Gammaproteobacteria bacterium]
MSPPRNAIAVVQRQQKALSMGIRAPDPAGLVPSPAWSEAATYLATRWFPRSQDKGLAIAELVAEAYRHALYWYPVIQQRCPGTFRPNWFVGTVLSWLRRVISPATGQWFFVANELAQEVDLADLIANACTLPGITNSDWAADSLSFLWDLAGSGGRKSVIGATVIDALGYLPSDALFEDMLQWRARAPRRRVLRQQRIGTASYLRIGAQVLIAADGHASRRTRDDIPWVDLRETPADVLDYRLSVETGKDGPQRLLIDLQPGIVSEARAEIAAIVTRQTTAPQRLNALRHYLRRFEAQHRFAPNAWSQFLALSRYAKSQTKRYLKAQLPRDMDKQIPSIRTTNSHVIPQPNPFLGALEIDEWERLFSPYRL